MLKIWGRGRSTCQGTPLIDKTARSGSKRGKDSTIPRRKQVNRVGKNGNVRGNTGFKRRTSPWIIDILGDLRDGALLRVRTGRRR